MCHSCFFQQSSFANFAVAPAEDVVKIRRDAPIEMLGPLGCGLQTAAGVVLNVMQPAAGQSIAVYGVGGVGLAGLMAARIAGCDPPIEMAFAKLKALLRRAPERTRDGLWRRIGALLDQFTPEECANYFRAAGYGNSF